MQGWIVAAAWAAAVVFAAIVLGFAAYEVSWKARRLSADRDRLLTLSKELTALGRPISAPRAD
jgi:hypothetical protein